MDATAVTAEFLHVRLPLAGGHKCAQANRERDSHVSGSCGCDLDARFRSFLDQCLVSSSTMASVGSGS